MGDFKDLKVWNRAHALTLNIYRLSATFPKSELFGLTQQIRRASVSINETWPRDVEGELIGNWRGLHS
jgi:hypothetical protein